MSLKSLEKSRLFSFLKKQQSNQLLQTKLLDFKSSFFLGRLNAMRAKDIIA